MEWNRREFIVKPMVVAGTARMLGRTESLLSKLAVGSGPLLERTLGKTGLKMPVVSMGVMNADIPGLVRRSYELGIRHFDTAAGYQGGRNEEMVGSVIKELGVRDKVIIATKQHLRDRPANPAEARRRFMEGVEASLRRLQMDHVEILYYHGVDEVEDARAEGPLEALQALKKDGKARFIGLSTHRTSMILPEAMRQDMFDVFLVTLNYTMAHDTEMLNAVERAAKSGIGIVAMKTQAGGTVKPDPKLPRELPPASQTALLKWALNHDFVTTAIPGYSTYQHLDQDFSVARNLDYTAEEKAFLADKSFVSQAEFCQQCGKCVADCPMHADVPRLMRAQMYAAQYRNAGLARDTMAGIASGRGLEACDGCESCTLTCRNSVNIARKIAQLRAMAGNHAC
ncbi:MAG TPA: aldo/keto reductase [Terriglobia bacterium]|nr:aldo/keto reductase [Terriglobia bacterium]